MTSYVHFRQLQQTEHRVIQHIELILGESGPLGWFSVADTLIVLVETSTIR
jgi:hypothetical protein